MASALLECCRWRSGNVSSPWSRRNELNGLIAGPRSRSSCTRALNDEGDIAHAWEIAERVPEHQTVIARVRLR